MALCCPKTCICFVLPGSRVRSQIQVTVVMPDMHQDQRRTQQDTNGRVKPASHRSRSSHTTSRRSTNSEANAHALEGPRRLRGSIHSEPESAQNAPRPRMLLCCSWLLTSTATCACIPSALLLCRTLALPSRASRHAKRAQRIQEVCRALFELRWSGRAFVMSTFVSFEALGFEMLRLFGTAGCRRPQTARFEHDFFIL